MVRNVTRWLVLLGTLGVVSVLGAACGAAEEPTPSPTAALRATPTLVGPLATATPSTAQPKYGGVMVAILPRDPPEWDPMRYIYFSGGLAQKMMNDGNLVKGCRFDMYTICPGLAESWEVSADATVYTFKIRDNVYWHDGVQFTAEDAKFFVDLSVNPPAGRTPSVFASNFQPLKSTEVLPGNKLRITLKSPNPFYLQSISDGHNTIGQAKHLMQPFIDKGQVNVKPHEFTGSTFNIVGTGPFKYYEYNQGSIFKVRKFERYYEKDAQGRQLPFVDEIDMPIITDPTANITAFMTGRADVTGRVSTHFITPEWMDLLKKNMGDKVQFLAGASTGSGGIAINSLKPPWNDIRVRKALFLWVDREEIQKSDTGFTRPATNFSALTPFANPEILKGPGYNPATRAADRAEAKRLLTEAGFPNGFPVKHLCNRPWIPACEPELAQMKGLGLQAELDIVDPAARTERIIASNFETLRSSVVYTWPFQASIDMRSDSAGAAVKHSDKRVDQLFDEMQKVKTQEELITKARELDWYTLREQYLWVPTTRGLSYIAHRDYVHRLTMQGSGWLNSDDAEAWMSK